MSEIWVIGVNFRTAPVELREQLHLARQQVLEILRTIRAEGLLEEALLLSTCNRTELVAVGQDVPARLPHLLAHLAAIKGLAAPPGDAIFYRLAGRQAAEHVLRVAAALDSQIVGEHEILGQVKQAYALACEARTAGFLLHKLMHWAMRAGKRVMSETALGVGAASTSAAAVDLARRVFSSLADKTVLLVGAGQMAELAARALIGAGVTSVIVANRTPARAVQLAERLQDQPLVPEVVDGAVGLAAESPDAPGAGPRVTVRAVGLEDLPRVIAQADLVISSTGSGEPVLTQRNVGPALGRSTRPVLLVDIAVPRDIEPELGELPNVFLYNIDGLDAIIQANIQRRQAEVPRAEAILADELERFMQWREALGVVPTIKLLQERVAGIQQAQIERYARNFPAAQRQQLEEFTRALCAKILHDPLAFLRELSRAPDGDPAAIDTLRRMFRLEASEDASSRDTTDAADKHGTRIPRIEDELHE